MNIKILPQYDNISFSETTGISYNIFFTGCSIRCSHCHNPELWDRSVGEDTNVNDVVDDIKKNLELIDSVCILGGEPTDQLEGLETLLCALQPITASIWLYTGRDLQDPRVQKVVNFCDYIKCGNYQHELAINNKENNACNVYNNSDVSEITLASSNQYFKCGGRINAD